MDDKIFKEFAEILKEYALDFKNNKELAVENSIPICWFGDIENYMDSKYKIVTVALNPSSVEFTKSRFSIPTNWENFIKSGIDTISDETLLELYNTLNKYFITNPYKRWFDNFETILHSLDASYEHRKKHQALHIDIYSAIATKMAWSSLSKDSINAICKNDFFDKMIDKLNPDLILISIARDKLIKKFHLENTSFIRYTYQKGIFMEGYKYSCKNKDIKIIYGRNYRGKPFTASSVPKEDKAFKEWVNNNIIKLKDSIDSTL